MAGALNILRCSIISVSLYLHTAHDTGAGAARTGTRAREPRVGGSPGPRESREERVRAATLCTHTGLHVLYQARRYIQAFAFTFNLDVTDLIPRPSTTFFVFTVPTAVLCPPARARIVLL